MTTDANGASTIERQSLETGKWANLFMAVAGVVAAYASHSDALLVDGLYSGVNFFSAIIAARISQSLLAPPDARYPFGYDAYEAIYVKYRSLVLLGIISFAIFGAIAKIIRYAGGGEVAALNFGPIVIYMVAMVAICFGLAAWHYKNWKLTGSRSELLQTEMKAAVVDGIISAGAGGGLVGAALLRGTPLEFIVPVSDSIVVLIMCGFIVGQPLRIFLSSLHEVAGGMAPEDVCAKARSIAEETAKGQEVDVLTVSTTKLGRSYFVIAYLKPKTSVTAEEVDAFREKLMSECQEAIGIVKTEVIITANPPYEAPQPQG
ncbi:cation transporter [Blastopirellula sp. JC732]|uniref:Cation transporter n=1 Tax=Blastopirellula sediminis TaxID=2894196 RepID=A0A9X1MQK6_9BACT|nr:cation transporter [Blastopirellula sediminis]MCC9606156.1 cation transporter [Blastopirellula sediminis]MCC9630545.1 cation transporter [Blastopirellula sediminis]